MFLYHRLALASFLAASMLVVNSSAQAEEDYAQQLLSLLELQTRIATRTKLNADFVPGVVSVLHGTDLEAKGVRTVADALALVPGMAVILDHAGRHQTITRGVGNTFISGSVKFLINDVAVNTASTALAEPVFHIPIEQVERIEVVRGPGSAVHGEFAYAGVVNVVTYRGTRRAYARAERYGRWGGGVMLDQALGSQARLSLNVAGSVGDGPAHWVAKDYLYDNPQWAQYSHAPGHTNEKREARSAFLTLGSDAVTLQLQHVQSGAGDFWGINEQLAPERDEIVRRDTFQSVGLTGSASLPGSATANWHLRWRRFLDERDSAFVMGQYGVDLYHDRDYEEARREAGVELEWEAGSQHRWLLGLSRAEIDVNESSDIFNGAAFAILPTNTSRRINSAWLQDEAKLTESLTITAGLRFDDYSDTEASMTPRVAGVWRASERDVFKAEYARAFRPPSFTEILFGRDIDPAYISTWELSYIRRNPHSLYRATLFLSDLDDLVVFNAEVEPGHFENADAAKTRGVELEAEVRLTRALRLDASVSYVDTEDENTGKPLAGAADWVGHLGVSYRPIADREWSLVYRHVSKYHREPQDWRAPLDGYDVLDASVNLYDFLTPGLTFRVGLRNLTDAKVWNPAMLQPEEDGLHAGPDFERAGRVYWGQLSYWF